MNRRNFGKVVAGGISALLGLPGITPSGSHSVGASSGPTMPVHCYDPRYKCCNDPHEVEISSGASHTHPVNPGKTLVTFDSRGFT